LPPRYREDWPGSLTGRIAFGPAPALTLALTPVQIAAPTSSQRLLKQGFAVVNLTVSE
jgi:hypothetical protein